MEFITTGYLVKTYGSSKDKRLWNSIGKVDIRKREALYRNALYKIRIKLLKKHLAHTKALPNS